MQVGCGILRILETGCRKQMPWQETECALLCRQDSECYKFNARYGMKITWYDAGYTTGYIYFVAGVPCECNAGKIYIRRWDLTQQIS